MSRERKWVGMQAIERSVGTAPCKDCPDRYPGCSGKCEKYQDWKRRMQEKKQEYLASVQPGTDYSSVRYEAKEASIRRAGHRVNQSPTGGIVQGRRK